jgi:hypothetical protein
MTRTQQDIPAGRIQPTQFDSVLPQDARAELQTPKRPRILGQPKPTPTGKVPPSRNSPPAPTPVGRYPPLPHRRKPRPAPRSPIASLQSRQRPQSRSPLRPPRQRLGRPHQQERLRPSPSPRSLPQHQRQCQNRLSRSSKSHKPTPLRQCRSLPQTSAGIRLTLSSLVALNSSNYPHPAPNSSVSPCASETATPSICPITSRS